MFLPQGTGPPWAGGKAGIPETGPQSGSDSAVWRGGFRRGEQYLLNLSGLPYLFPGYAENWPHGPLRAAPSHPAGLHLPADSGGGGDFPRPGLLPVPGPVRLADGGIPLRPAVRTVPWLGGPGRLCLFLGLGAAWLLQRFGTLLAPWLFHMAANLISVLLEHFSGQLAFLNLLLVFLAETGIALGLPQYAFWASAAGAPK